MSNNQKNFTMVNSYIFCWVLLVIAYFIFSGIMYLINIIGHFDQNHWLIGGIVLLLWSNHQRAKGISKLVAESVEEDNEKGDK